MPSTRGYFDFNATGPMTAAAREAWLAAAERHWHNPSGLYREAGEARRMIEDWRTEVADLFGIDDPERVVFTGGATEANNAVVRHLAAHCRGAFAVSEIEHPSVAAAVVREARLAGVEVRKIPTDPATGAVDPDAVAGWIAGHEVGAVSVMAANNETGALQPWREIAAMCREVGIPFHTDAVQWIGKLDPAGLGGAGYVVGSAHKFGGGPGTGFLLLPEEDEDEAEFQSLVGGPQEGGRRAGTEDLPGIAAMVAALAERDTGSMERIGAEQSRHRDRFEAHLQESLDVEILAASGRRLWNTSMLVLPHTRNVKWLARLSQRGFAVSTGSACSAGQGNPSAVMMAMGLGYEAMGRVLRISGGPATTEDEWQSLAEAIEEVGRELRG